MASNVWDEYDRAARWFAQFARRVGTKALDVSDACAALVERDPAAFTQRIRLHATREQDTAG